MTERGPASLPSGRLYARSTILGRSPGLLAGAVRWAVARLEHPPQGRHHPTGGIVGSSRFDLALLEARQWFEKEEVFGSQGTAGMRRENSQADQINHDGRDCSEAVCNGSEQP